MACANLELAIEMNNLGLHSLSRKRLNVDRLPFADVDTFEGVPSNPVTLHKYAYGNGDPINNIDPSGHMAEGLQGLVVRTGIQAGLYALTFGSIRFGFAKARGLETSVALREGFTAAGWGALTAVPVLGQLVSGYFLYQTAHGLAAGQFDDMDRLELATYFAAALILGRMGPKISDIALPSIEEPPPGVKMSKASRLALIFNKLKSYRANNAQEGYDVLSRVMKEVEDAHSGEPAEINPGLNTERMYPPQADNIQTYEGMWVMRSRLHRIVIGKGGGVGVIDLKSGKMVMQEGPLPQLPPTFYTNDGD